MLKKDTKKGWYFSRVSKGGISLSYGYLGNSIGLGNGLPRQILGFIYVFSRWNPHLPLPVSSAQSGVKEKSSPHAKLPRNGPVVSRKGWNRKRESKS